ncbi:hypothetical protein KM043_005964 [Ampulex compressa]|nr:hypothetical protein KM043_005964 [Ampulex compressa]
MARGWERRREEDDEDDEDDEDEGVEEDLAKNDEEPRGRWMARRYRRPAEIAPRLEPGEARSGGGRGGTGRYFQLPIVFEDQGDKCNRDLPVALRVLGGLNSDGGQRLSRSFRPDRGTILHRSIGSRRQCFAREYGEGGERGKRGGGEARKRVSGSGMG